MRRFRPTRVTRPARAGGWRKLITIRYAITFASLILAAAGCATDLGPANALAPTAISGSTFESAPEPRAREARVELTLPTTVETVREPWVFAAHPGSVISTPNYRLYTTIDYERILQRLPLFLECAMIRYRTALADLPAPPRRLETYIFRDRRQWSAKTRQLLPEQAGDFQALGRGGFTTRGISVLYYIDWSGRDRDTLAIAAHEGWHQYTQSTFRNPLPVWLEEGIATYMEGYRFRRSDAIPQFQPGRNWERGRTLGEAMHAGRLIPLDELLERSPQSFLKSGKDELLTYYAQVWALTRFLADGADGRYRQGLAQLLTDAADGQLYRRLSRSPAVLARGGRSKVLGSRDGPWVIYAYFTSDLATFQGEYLEYVRTISR